MKSEFKNCLEYMNWVSLRSQKKHSDALFHKNMIFIFGREEVAAQISRTLVNSGVHHNRKKETIEVAETELIREVVFIDEEE